MNTLLEEAARLSRGLNDPRRRQEIGMTVGGDLVVCGATFDVNDVLRIVRDAVGRDLARVDPASVQTRAYGLERWGDFALCGLPAPEIRRVGEAMDEAWIMAAGAGHEPASHETVRFAVPGIGEFRALLGLCREVSGVRAAHGDMLYEATAPDVVEVARTLHERILSEEEAAALLARIRRPDMVERTVEAGADWARQRRAVLRCLDVALSGFDLSAYPEAPQAASGTGPSGP